MQQVATSREFPSLFSHKKRADWGVGVLSGEEDGKRRYLFEDGEERIMGAGGIQLMFKVEAPDRDQQATCARLLALLAKREGRSESNEAAGASAVIKQLERLHKKYPSGFSGKEWRSDEKNMHARQTRTTSAPKVQAELSPKNFEKLERAQRYEEIWGQVVRLLGESGLVQGPLKSPSNAEQQRLLAEKTRELLHGSDTYEARFDRFIAAYESALREPPSWQVATALPALMSPVNHVYVEPTSFRKQLKALSRYSAFAARPNGPAYTRCLGMAQALANMLAARGEVPRDLLDVHDFVRVTV
ncbi:MAG TPA: hypothetical protein VNG33_11335 [Polyangiaceae bacterium]|nr:hypothetical protein [Polyangiaceae bacterium]